MSAPVTVLAPGGTLAIPFASRAQVTVLGPYPARVNGVERPVGSTFPVADGTTALNVASRYDTSFAVNQTPLPPSTGGATATPLASADTGLFGDSFAGRADGAPGAGYSDYAGGIFSISSNALVAAAGGGGDFATHHLTRANAVRDVRLARSFTGTASVWNVGLPGRGNEGTNTRYLPVVGSSGTELTLAIYKLVNGSVSVLVAPAGIGNAPYMALPVRAEVTYSGINPTNITLAVYDDATDALLGSTGAQDSEASLQVAGSTGVTVWSNGAGIPKITGWQDRSLGAADKLLVLVGDSNFSGTISIPNTSQRLDAQLGRLLGDGWQILNLGVAGKTAASMDSDAASQIATVQGMGFSKVQVVIMAGTNDLGTGGATAAQAWASIQSLSTKWKAAGKVALCTILPASFPGVYPANFNVLRSDLNATYIRANYKSVSDALIEVGGDARIGYTGAETRGDLFVRADRTHLLTKGVNILAPMIETTVRGLASL